MPLPTGPDIRPGIRRLFRLAVRRDDLAHADVGSAYGAASSLIVLLLWCYYAAQIIFFGAEFTRVTDLSEGGRNFSKLDRPVRRDLSL